MPSRTRTPDPPAARGRAPRPSRIARPARLRPRRGCGSSRCPRLAALRLRDATAPRARRRPRADRERPGGRGPAAARSGPGLERRTASGRTGRGPRAGRPHGRAGPRPRRAPAATAGAGPRRSGPERRAEPPRGPGSSPRCSWRSWRAPGRPRQTRPLRRPNESGRRSACSARPLAAGQRPRIRRVMTSRPDGGRGGDDHGGQLRARSRALAMRFEHVPRAPARARAARPPGSVALHRDRDRLTAAGPDRGSKPRRNRCARDPHASSPTDPRSHGGGYRMLPEGQIIPDTIPGPHRRAGHRGTSRPAGITGPLSQRRRRVSPGKMPSVAGPVLPGTPVVRTPVGVTRTSAALDPML